MKKMRKNKKKMRLQRENSFQMELTDLKDLSEI